MRLDVRAVNFQMSESLGDHAQRRLHAALDRFEPRVEHVELRLVDDHGRRHGVSMHCVIDAAIRGCGRLHIDQEAADLFQAVDMAAGRIKRSVRRRINRRRDVRLRRRAAI